MKYDAMIKTGKLNNLDLRNCNTRSVKLEIFKGIQIFISLISQDKCRRFTCQVHSSFFTTFLTNFPSYEAILPTIFLFVVENHSKQSNQKIKVEFYFDYYIRQIFMHKPLSLYPQGQQPQSGEFNSKSSSIYKYADSLAFSLSSEKKQSQQSSFFAYENKPKVSKQLQSLQMKIENLQNKIAPITLENCKSNSQNKTAKYNNKFDRESTAQYFRRKKLQSEDKQNKFNSTNAPGKIVRRRQESKEKWAKTINKRDRIESQSNQSKNSLLTETTGVIQRSNEVIKLKKEIQVMKNSLEKSQRSVSLCSERLSQSKSVIKQLKMQEKRYEKNVEKLKQDLKKSQTIREKQKKIILNQRKQLEKCRQILKRCNKN